MDESTFRSLVRRAIGETDLPPHVRDQTRTALRQAVSAVPKRHQWIPGAVAALLAVAIVAGFLGASMLRRSQSPIVTPSTGTCAASTLVVTGTKGERLYPGELPPGFVLTEGHEDEIGVMGSLTYTIPGGGDQPRISLLRYFTNMPVENLLGGSERHSVTVQGKAGVWVGGPPGPDFMGVAWVASGGTALVVSGYKISEAQLLAVADKVKYEPGTQFVYPVRPTVTVTHQQALDKVSGSASTKRAVLTSLGEVDAVTHPTGDLHHKPILAPAVEVIRPVWMVWATASNAITSVPVNGIVLDGNSAQQLAQIRGVDPAALSSLTDRSQSGCTPPFGVLTRSEFKFLFPATPGITGTAKLMTLQMLRSIKEGDLGNCMLAACDPDVPLWVWIEAASDCSLMFRCGPPPGLVAPPTPPPGSWAMTPFDARTGPQNTGLGTTSGHGELPADVVSLPDLAPEP